MRSSVAKKRQSWRRADALKERVRDERNALRAEGFEPLEPVGATLRAAFTDPASEIVADLPHMRLRVGTVVEADSFEELLAKTRAMLS